RGILVPFAVPANGLQKLVDRFFARALSIEPEREIEARLQIGGSGFDLRTQGAEISGRRGVLLQSELGLHRTDRFVRSAIGAHELERFPGAVEVAALQIAARQ